MVTTRKISFTGPLARFQYMVLMALFRVAITRGLFGRFARGLGRIFPAGNAAYLHLNGAPPFKIYLNDGYWTRFALWHHDYEPEIERAIMAAAGHSPLFCDLGANKGFWTVRAARLFDQVAAVEASADTFTALHENAAELPNVTLHRAAIHETSGQSMSFVNVTNSHASAQLLLGGSQPEGDVETVETISIDDLVPPGTAALIKLDVEGAEIAALTGATRALAEGSAVLYEDHGADHDCAPSAYLLEMPDMVIWSVDDIPVRLTSVAEVRALKTDRFRGYNFMAARKDAPLALAIINALQKDGEPDRPAP